MDFKVLLEAFLDIPSPSWFQALVGFLKEHDVVSSAAILENLHSVFYVALAYQVWYLIALRLVFPRLTRWRLSHTKNPQDEKRAENLNIQAAIHFVSLLQSIVVVYLSLLFLCDKEKSAAYQDASSRIFGSCRDTEVITVYAIGYFVWDMYISAMHSTLPFVLHGIVSTIVFTIGLKPYLQYYAPVFLMFELSNPFLNFRWFGLKYLPTENRLCGVLLLLNNLVLLLLFFGARIAWGWYQIAKLTWDFYLVRNDDQFLLLEATIIVVGNLILDVLNAVWFSTMLTVAIKTIRGKAKTD